ncbi:MAG: hypothetical protein HQM03_20335 [Magnetococcales bacterium]|nr:hypothetical protein [Magnetococcales bacterium]
MMIAASNTVTAGLSGTAGHASARSGTANAGFGPEYRVDVSARARDLAVNAAATGITESKMRNVLTRILLETLFKGSPGVDDPNRESAEEELAREVAVDPVMDGALDRMVENAYGL